MFVRQGYAATSLRQIAKGAGIAKATVYHHFPDKRALFEELLGDSRAAMDETLAALEGEADPRKRLEEAARASLRFLAEHADLLQVARREVPGARERVKADAGRFLGRCEGLIAEAVATGRRQGAFRRIPPADAALVFMSMMQGSFARAILQGAKLRSPVSTAAALLDVFLYGIADAPRGAGS